MIYINLFTQRSRFMKQTDNSKNSAQGIKEAFISEMEYYSIRLNNRINSDIQSFCLSRLFSNVETNNTNKQADVENLIAALKDKSLDFFCYKTQDNNLKLNPNIMTTKIIVGGKTTTIKAIVNSARYLIMPDDRAKSIERMTKHKLGEEKSSSSLVTEVTGNLGMI